MNSSGNGSNQHLTDKFNLEILDPPSFPYVALFGTQGTSSLDFGFYFLADLGLQVVADVTNLIVQVRAIVHYFRFATIE